jgi:predicted secreted protein
MHGRHLLTPLAVAALAAGAAAPATAKTIQVTAEEAGSLVKASSGDRIRIALPANQTTGYRWVTTNKPRRRVARIVRSRYVADRTDPPVIGSGGEQIVVVKARRRGRTMLSLQYRQVGSDKAGSDFDLWIRVRR